MKKSLALAAMAVALLASESHAGPVRNLIDRVREKRSERQGQCQSSPALAPVRFAIVEAVQSAPTVERMRGLFGWPKGCPGGICPAPFGR